MTFDTTSVEVTSATLPKEHCVQVPWNTSKYSDNFSRYHVLHTWMDYVQNEWSLSLSSFWTKFRRDKGLSCTLCTLLETACQQVRRDKTLHRLAKFVIFDLSFCQISRNTNRIRKIIWYNPPFSKRMLKPTEYIRNHFLKLVDKQFPKGYKLRGHNWMHFAHRL